MIPRKKRITIVIVMVTLIILMILGILGYLYMNTDILKSKEVLFSKYLMQNLENIDILKIENDTEINKTLNTNKYMSQIKGTIEYMENKTTSTENNINDVEIEINSNIDKINNYDYKDIAIKRKDEKLLGLEYLNNEETYGVRLNDIKEFVSFTLDEQNQNDDEAKILNIGKILSQIDFNSFLSFTEEEKQQLANSYINIIKTNVPSKQYYKQSNATIIVNNKSIQTNAYSIKLTIEEYNNLIIKILEQITNDEIILSRVDLIEYEIKERYPEYNDAQTLREEFINYINENIEKIQNNNIGKEEVKVTVYEKGKRTVRTSIEKTTEKFTVDLYDETSIKFNKVIYEDVTEEKTLKIEKTKNESQCNTTLDYVILQDNEEIKDIKLIYQQEFEQNENLTRHVELSVKNEDYEGIFKIEENVKFVKEFEEEITLDTDNIDIAELPQSTKETIVQILNENFEKQLSSLYSVVSLDEYKKMLGNLEIIEKTSIELPINGEVTEIERNRFNSQFEFFVSENLTSDNIKQLINTTKGNFENMGILTKDGKLQELNIEKLTSETEEASEYKKEISEIVIFVKQNFSNDEKQEDLLKYIEVTKNNKYIVSIEYDDNGLARVIRAKIQENT